MMEPTSYRLEKWPLGLVGVRSCSAQQYAAPKDSKAFICSKKVKDSKAGKILSLNPFFFDIIVSPFLLFFSLWNYESCALN